MFKKDEYEQDSVAGLDPALPFFATLNDQWKLDPSDAEFVDVIHTGAGYFGKIEAAGHVDFYINGGYIQPACKESACECPLRRLRNNNSFNSFLLKFFSPIIRDLPPHFL